MKTILGSSNKPLPEGKMSVSEGGIRVPAVIWQLGNLNIRRVKTLLR